MKINLACGRTPITGWFNVDLISNPMAKRPPDLLCDIKKIPLPDGCADTVMGIHCFEHLWPWDCGPALDEWSRLLVPKGLLILEMPDLLKCCRAILYGKTDAKYKDQLGLFGLFGDYNTKDPLMMHRFSWTFTSIKPLLEAHGYYQIVEKQTEFHSVGRDIRDFRVEARRRAKAETDE